MYTTKTVIKGFKLILAIVVLILICAFTSFAANQQSSVAKMNDNQSGLMSIAHRGDTSEFPKNSLEGSLSAFEKGADFVSLSVMMSKDGVIFMSEDDTLNHIFDTELTNINETQYSEIENLFFLDENAKPTKYNPVTLEKLLKSISKDDIIILDNSWAIKDEIYSLVSSLDMLDNVILRTYQSDKEIIKWTDSLEEKMSVIGVYDSFVVFTAISHLENLSENEMPLVQYESKNYFNMFYTNVVGKKFNQEQNARAIASAYEYNKSGQRPDSQRGWDELVGLGYSVIETNNIEQLSLYIQSSIEISAQIDELLQRCKSIDTSLYSIATQDNLSSIIKKAEKVNMNTSLEQKQDVHSKLILDMNSLVYATKEDTQEGSLNITLGKILATVFMAVVIIAAQVYIYKMKAKKSK